MPVVLDVDTTNGRVGIGNSVPGQALEVTGSIHAKQDNSFIGVDDNGTPRVGFLKKAGANPKLAHGSGTTLVITRGSADSISSSNSYTDEVTIDTSGNVGIGVTPTSKFHVSGPLATGITTTAKTSAYTATATDSTILADASGGTFQITLPTAVGCAGRQYTVKRTGATNNVTVGGTSAQTLDGATTKTLGSQNATLTVQSDNANWQILSMLGTVS